MASVAIPVFVSLPSRLTPVQAEIRDALLARIRSFDLEPRTVGSPYDVALRNPLHEVRTVARHCSGGLILGFVQMYVNSGMLVRGEDAPQPQERLPFPTPWNQLETGVLFGLGLPILVFREPGINGGIFDIGSSDVFLQEMPTRDEMVANADIGRLSRVLTRWTALVCQHYYGE